MKHWTALLESEFDPNLHTLSFNVQMKPTAQPRHRSGVNRRTGKPVHYEAPKSHFIHAYKSAIAHAGRKIMSGAPPIDMPIRVHITNYFVAPKSLSGLQLNEMGGLCCTGPDWDNLGKSACDALNGIVWTDDRRIVSGSSTKRFCLKGQAPYVNIDVRILGQEKVARSSE